MPLLVAAMAVLLASHCSGTAAFFVSGPEFDPRDGLSQAQVEPRERRTGSHTLSIVAPLDVLRQRLLLELGRRRMRQSEDQIKENRKLLTSIGKRTSTPIERALWPSSWDSFTEDLA